MFNGWLPWCFVINLSYFLETDFLFLLKSKSTMIFSAVVIWLILVSLYNLMTSFTFDSVSPLAFLLSVFKYLIFLYLYGQNYWNRRETKEIREEKGKRS